MNKSVTLKIDGVVEEIFGYDQSTMIMFQVSYNPHFEKGDSVQSEYSFYCHGMEWGEESYSLEFKHGEIKEHQTVEIEFGGNNAPTIEPKRNIVKDEKRCNFCNKLSDEVGKLSGSGLET